MFDFTRQIPRLAFAIAACLWPLAAQAQEAPTYERDIRPLLAKRCTICHNEEDADDEELSGGLALDSLEAIMEGAPSEKIVEAGDSSASALYLRLATDDEDLLMPLGEDPLSVEVQDLVKRWIDAGLPRGERTAVPESTALPASSVRRVVRTQDVLLPIATKVPKDFAEASSSPGGSLELALKIGPMPAVSALAFVPGRPLLAVGSAGAVLLWNMDEGVPETTLAGITGTVHALALNHDGTLLAVGAGLPSRTGQVRVHELPSGNLLHDFEGHEDVVYGLSFRPDKAELASASFDQTVRVWNLESGQPIGSITSHSDFVHDVSYTPDGKSLLSVSKDRSIKQFDADTLESLRTFSGHNEDILALAIHPDGKRFITAGLEPPLNWWSLDQEKLVKKTPGHGGPVHDMSLSGDGSRLLTAGGDSTARVWNVETGKVLRSLSGPTEWQFASALSADGKLSASGGWDGVTRVWDTETGQLLATLLQPPGESLSNPDWLLLTPAGYFAASPTLAPLIRYRVAGQEVAPEAFNPLLHQCDPLRKAQNEPNPFVP